MGIYEVQVRLRSNRWESVAIRAFSFPNLAGRAAERHAREVECETRVVEVASGRVVARYDAKGTSVGR
jgi:hypothetical protein